MIRFALEVRGCRVEEANNGEAAVEAARKTPPDLILMDLTMPVLDGYGAVRAIREIPPLESVPVIAISAHKSVDHRNKALDVGFDGYLPKPINFSELDQLVQRFLPSTFAS
jgi:two-component system cell cycle response regulator DivK